MAAKKTYVATQDFSLTIDNGQKNVYVKRGDVFTFDGLYVECNGEKGQAHSLVRAAGDWYEPYKGKKKVVSAAAKASASTTSTTTKAEPTRNRTATGGKIVEPSDAALDPDVASAQNLAKTAVEPAQNRNRTGGQIVEASDASEDTETVTTENPESGDPDLQSLIDQYEAGPSETVVTSDMDDIKKEVQVINSDADIVAQVSPEAHTDSTVTNTSGVQIQEQTVSKPIVIVDDQQVVKETNYSGKTASEPAEARKLVVDVDAQGVEVAKTSTPTSHTGDVKSSTVDEGRVSAVSVEERVVKETNYVEPSAVDVGSSTQAQVVKARSPRKSTRKASAKKSMKTGTKKGSPAGNTKRSSAPVVGADAQDGVVVAKVSKDTAVVQSEGITSTVSVGSPGEVSVGEVEFSSNDGIDVGKATVSSGSIPAVDLADTDIDINALLDNS